MERASLDNRMTDARADVSSASDIELSEIMYLLEGVSSTIMAVCKQ